MDALRRKIDAAKAQAYQRIKERLDASLDFEGRAHRILSTLPSRIEEAGNHGKRAFRLIDGISQSDFSGKECFVNYLISRINKLGLHAFPRNRASTLGPYLEVYF